MEVIKMTELKRVLIEGYSEEKALQEEVNQSWAQIYGARQNNLILQSLITGIEVKLNKPCAVVFVGDVRGYIPLEFSGEQDAHELRKLVGEPVAFKIVEYDRDGDTFIASRQAALEHMENVTWKRLEQDAVITAVVRIVERKSLKVDIGGILLTIPVEEIGYGWFDDLRDYYEAGDHIKVKVTELNKESKIVVVSKKAMDKNPWPDCTKRYSKGSEYVGTVSGVAEYGIFIRLEAGVDALVKHPRFEKVQKGKKVLVRILNVDVKRERIYGVITKIIK